MPAAPTRPPEPAHHWIDGSPQLHAVEWRADSDPTLLLLHGATHQSMYWEPLARLLAPYRVLGLDLRGHGASEWGEAGSYDAAHYLDDLERAIDRLVPTGPFALIGHSLGSLISMPYAAAHAERLWAAVFIDIDPRPPEGQRERLHEAGARPPRSFGSLSEARARLEQLTPGLSIDDYDLLAEATFEEAADGTCRQRMDQRTLAEFPQFDHTSMLAGIEVPALVVRGAASNVSSAEAADAAVAALPRGELATVEGGHHLHVQEPQTLAEVLRAFLERWAPRHEGSDGGR